MRIHTLPGVFDFGYAALQRNVRAVGKHHAGELQIEARRLVDSPFAFRIDLGS